MTLAPIMYDSVTPAAIPRSALIVAGYDDGQYAWKPTDWAMFPKATHVTIATTAATLLSTVLDVETGDASPADVPEWCAKRAYIKAPRGVVYTSLSNWPNVTRALDGVPATYYPMFWIAQWDGKPVIPKGAIAKQYRSPVAPAGDESPGWYDMTVTTGLWPGVPHQGLPASVFAGFTQFFRRIF